MYISDFNKFIKAINQGNKKKAEYFFNDLKEYLYIKEQCYEKKRPYPEKMTAEKTKFNVQRIFYKNQKQVEQ